MEILGKNRLNKPDLRKLHLYVQTNKYLRHLGRLEFGKSDPSIYIYPYGRTGHYSYGVGSFEAEEEVETTFDFREHNRTVFCRTFRYTLPDNVISAMSVSENPASKRPVHWQNRRCQNGVASMSLRFSPI